MPAPHRFGGPIDAMGFALMNALLHPLSSDPTGLGVGDLGRVWVRSDIPTIKYWDGTAARDVLARASQTGSQPASTISDFTAAVRALEWRTMQPPSADVPMASRGFTTMRAATQAGEAVEYAQFQNAIAQVQSGMDFKSPPAQVVMTSNVSLTAPGSSMNGRTMQPGDGVLLTGQTDARANGIYVWNSSTSLTRRADSSGAGSIFSGTLIDVGAADNTNPDTIWMQVTVGTGTNSAIVIGTDSQSWIQPFKPTTYTGSNGVQILGSVIQAAVAGTAGAADTAVQAKAGILVDSSGLYLDPATSVRKVFGSIPASSGGIYTVSGSTVTIADGIPNINKKLVLKAGPSPQSINGVTPSTGETIGVAEVTSTTNTVVPLPAAPTVGAWTYEIIG